MVRSIHKINIIFIITLLIATVAVIQNGSSVNADTEDVDFNVNVTEALTVSISTPASWASGDAGDLLRNKVTVSALTNDKSGVTVSMYADGTDLQNTAAYSSSDATTYIPTLDSDTYTANTFPTNAWGYSLTDTVAGTDASYLPMTTSTEPIEVLKSTIGSQGSKDVFFGAKASTAKKSGTYAQTVYFTAVTGTIDSSTNPEDPLYPSTPSNPTDSPAYDSGTGNPATGQTTYTRRTTTGSGSSSVSGSTNDTTTQVSKGDTRSSYVRAAGVTSTTPTTTTSDNISTLGIALASAAGVAAVSGIFFLVAAKRRKDDDE
ncbi:hypothetical protein IKF84_02025 [Candidatus Saccharibacteria bacterium]|nr:hypothetical protein [Candidatus Saccharibacteria bacterium]